MTDTSDWFTGFSALDHRAGDVPIHARIGGRADAPPLVLLHGFPQNHAMWQRVARQLAPHFRLVLPDLRGYGDSGKPPGDPAHVAYAKRTMAGDIADLMAALGHERYAVCGHDRGGRVAHRLALDHPAAVTRLAVLDIAPTLDMYQATDMRFATFYHHWFHLIQPSPLPETMIGGDRLFYLHWTLGGWGAGGLAHIEPEALASYERCFDDPPPSTPCARTTAPRPPSTSSTTAPPERRGTRSRATPWCCGAARRGRGALRPAGVVAGAVRRSGQRPGAGRRALSGRGTADRDSHRAAGVFRVR